MTGVQIPAEAENSTLRHCIQTGSGAQPAAYPMSVRGPFHSGKAARV